MCIYKLSNTKRYIEIFYHGHVIFMAHIYDTIT